MRLVEMLRKSLHALAVRDVQRVVLNFGESAISRQSLSVLQLCILAKLVDGSFPSAFVSSCEVDEEFPAIEG